MLGDKVSSIEAERMGMIYKVVDDANFVEESKKLVKQLASMPTRGLAFTKQALNVSFINSFDQQLHDEDRLQQQAAATFDFREGTLAFIEKRMPVFKGE
jgi:2-(1,2-epoxy-1,2-dihydrophenyl)acetyl-CoA isomerase